MELEISGITYLGVFGRCHEHHGVILLHRPLLRHRTLHLVCVRVCVGGGGGQMGIRVRVSDRSGMKVSANWAPDEGFT